MKYIYSYTKEYIKTYGFVYGKFIRKIKCTKRSGCRSKCKSGFKAEILYANHKLTSFRKGEVMSPFCLNHFKIGTKMDIFRIISELKINV